MEKLILILIIFIFLIAYKKTRPIVINTLKGSLPGLLILLICFLVALYLGQSAMSFFYSDFALTWIVVSIILGFFLSQHKTKNREESTKKNKNSVGWIIFVPLVIIIFILFFTFFDSNVELSGIVMVIYASLFILPIAGVIWLIWYILGFFDKDK